MSLDRMIRLQCYTTYIIFFFFNDPAPPETSPLPLHAAFPIYHGTSQVFRFDDRREMPYRQPLVRCVHEAARRQHRGVARRPDQGVESEAVGPQPVGIDQRSEEHTSELQSQSNLVCRLLLEKKN